MKNKQILAIILIGISIHLYAQDLIISEIVGSNTTGITDTDGSTPDWIEIYNAGNKTVHLAEYSLSDNSQIPDMWVFPDQTLASGEFLVLYAVGETVDTNVNIPTFYETVLDIGDEMNYILPTAEPDSNWTSTAYDDSSWETGKNSFGYGDGDDTTIVAKNISLYLRTTIQIENVDQIANCIFNMDFDDGFVAYLNGTEIARSGLEGTPPPFNETASGHEAVMYTGGSPEKFIVEDFANILVEGVNTIAIQIHNADLNSSDLSAIPFLTLEYYTEPANPKGLSQYLDFSNDQETPIGIYLNFKINAGNDTVFLYKNNSLVDKLSTKNIPTDVSIGRTNNNLDTAYFFLSPTPGAKNTTQIYPSEMLPKPFFSHSEGVYNTSFYLRIETNKDTCLIRYTTDGSIPNESSPVFNEDILISSNSNIRARIYQAGYIPGAVRTESFIFYSGKQTLPIVSITANPDDFFDYNTGIYVDGPNIGSTLPFYGANYWEPWEKPIHIELFEPDGSTGFSMDAGVKIFGNYSRTQAQKSLVIYARSQYGDKTIKYQIFKDKPLTEFKSFLLRNSGNDFNNTMMRDGTTHTLVSNMGLDYMAYRPAILYINGAYWGIQNIREKSNEDYVAANHGISVDSISVLGPHGELKYGSDKNYVELLDFMENNDLSIQSNFDVVEKDLDIQNFIDYYNMEIYIVNEDWPGNNIKFWRENNAQGKWRHIIYDTDYGFGIWEETKVTNNMIEFATEPDGPHWPNPPISTLMLRSLLQNEQFTFDFVNGMADRLNTTYLPDSVNPLIDSLWGAIRKEMSGHAKRWYDETPQGQYYYYLYNIEQMHVFANERPAFVRKHYEDYFNISGSYDLYISLSDNAAGRIHLNSITLSSFPWRGQYFNTIPISLTAIPKPGYRFIRWEGDISSTERTISGTFSDSTNITAVFEYDSSLKPDIIITEINYNSNILYKTGDWLEIFNNKNTDQDISGWFIKDSKHYNSYTIPANTSIPANSYLVLCRDTASFKTYNTTTSNIIGNIHFDFSERGETISLLDTFANTIDQVRYSDSRPWPMKADGYGYTLQLNSIGDNNSVAQNWNSGMRYGTPGKANMTVLQNMNNYSIVINEINYKSHENANSGDWIELYNRSSEAVDISDWVINDNNNNNIYIVPENTVINAGAYLVLTESPALFALIYPDITDTVSINFKLSSAGDVISLYDRYESLVDQVAYQFESPWPLNVFGTGRTLMLISPDLDNSLAENWDASELLGTPGAANIANDLSTSQTNTLQVALSMVYPTYCHSTITIEPNGKSLVYIFNELGILMNKFYAQGKTQYNTSLLAKGIYFVYLVDDTATYSFQIIKE